MTDGISEGVAEPEDGGGRFMRVGVGRDMFRVVA